VAPQFQQSPDTLENTYVGSSTGAMVPLASFAHFGPSNTSLGVNHQGQWPSVTISFNLAPGVSLGDATQLIERAQKSIAFPATIHASFQGTAAAFQESLANEPILILTALLTVYIVLGILYESYIHPITILSGLPSACLGALATLIFFKVDLNIYSFVGLVLLVGLVKKNAIMQIDFALEAERRGNKTSAEAIYEGCLIRFRPIMMTTWAALLGAVPMALGYGSGGEARRPLGLAVCGGLLISQMVTLYLTPVVYTYMSSMLDWWRRRHPESIEGEPTPAYGD
jgi:multidrug efflux pump subunit AcrB